MKQKFRQTASALMASLMVAGAVCVPALAAEDHLLIAPAPGESAPVSTPVSAAESVYGYQLEVDGEMAEVALPVMVPLVKVAEPLGFTVAWNGDGTIVIDSGAMHSTITIGVDSYQAITSLEDAEGATGPLKLGAAPVVIDGATYVPLELFDILLGNGAVTLEGGKIVVDTGSNTEMVQIPNPWAAYDTMEAAEQAAGFSMTLPAAVEDYAETVYQVLPSEDGATLEVLCRNGDDRLVLRKAPGAGDISGDYTIYGQERTVTADGRSVTLKGEDGRFALAIWADGGYTYSVHTDAPLSAAELTALVGEIR